ncbi:long-chain fatty acid--CoA ligase [Streptomyces sp. NPDC048506]|uniref:class I adenylate-forming enzyme family protein n=1 Tax=Streptomyces sp. NPDC048506 TaxID=3155028 RepID=UPI00341584DF
MTTGQAAGRSGATASSGTPHTDWVDDVLLHGPAHDICLVLDEEIDRQALRTQVMEHQKALEHAGLRAGGTVALQLPPSLGYVALLLAAWRLGAQLVLLDHRLTGAETERAVAHTNPQLLVSTGESASAMRGFHQVTPEFTARPTGEPARTDHVLIQLSSGSTGPSKVIGRTAEDLVTELERYSRLDGMPQSGEQLVILGSLSHTWGLVGGLLHGLHSGARVVLPARTSVRGILATVAAAPVATTLLGVPAQVALLASVERPPQLPLLVRMMTAGGRTPTKVARAFTERYAVPLSQCYGMTETGMITMDLSGTHHPAVGRAVPGVRVRVENGELLVALPRSPYLGDTPQERWSDGWLHTLDAGEIDPATGVVTVLGRLDSQVSIRGLKVDLTEVEETLTGLAGVTEAVVLHQDAIDAYVTLAPEVPLARIKQELADRLADFKLPSRWYVLPQFPRTATGKPRRDPAVLRAAAA